MNTKKFFIAVFFSVVAIFAVSSIATRISTHKAEAFTDADYVPNSLSVFGTAWSSDIGWISFNNCTSTSSGCSGPSYSVNLDPKTGELSGAAWSSNVGWIVFDAATVTAHCSAQPTVVIASGAFRGFAWSQSSDQCIALSAADAGQSGWGWQENTSTGVVTGAAWGDLNFGWIVPSSNMRIDQAIGKPASITGSCSQSGDYSISWTPVTGATYYSLRVDNTANGWADNPCNYPGDLCKDTTATSYSGSGPVGANYSVWVHARNASGAWSAPVGSSFSCTSNYSITAIQNPNGNVTPSGVTTVPSGNSKSYSISANNGYKIGSVLVDGVSVGSGASYTFTNVQSDHTISATFVHDAPVVTLNANPTSGTVNSVNPTLTWSATNNPTSCTASGDWTGSKSSSGTQAQGVLTSVRAYTYTLTCTNDGGSGSDTATVQVTSPTSYTVSVCPSHPNGTITPSGTSTVAAGGTSGPYTIKANPGYSYQSLTINGANHAAVSPYTFSNVNVNSTICAGFTSNTLGLSHTISATSDGPGTISPYGDTTVSDGGNQTYTITPNSGKRLETLIVDGNPVTLTGTTYQFKNVLSNHTIYALFGDSIPPGLKQCQNTIDDDQDGLIDFTGGTLNGVPVAKDPGCTSPTDNSEGNPSIIYIEQ